MPFYPLALVSVNLFPRGVEFARKRPKTPEQKLYEPMETVTLEGKIRENGAMSLVQIFLRYSKGCTRCTERFLHCDGCDVYQLSFGNIRNFCEPLNNPSNIFL